MTENSLSMELKKKEITEEQARSRLAALCSRAEHCTGEMRTKMRQWGLAPEAQERIVSHLVEHRYVDDERFCRYFVRDKIQFNRWGRRKVEQALYAKQVSREVFGPILDEYEEESYAEVLRPLLESKRRSIKAANEYERRTKLMRFALGRGFTIDVIKRCMNDADPWPDD